MNLKCRFESLRTGPGCSSSRCATTTASAGPKGFGSHHCAESKGRHHRTRLQLSRARHAVLLVFQGHRCSTRVPAQPDSADQADDDTGVARKLADQYQPMIIDAEKDKEDSDFHFQQFAQLTSQVCRLWPPTASLPVRAGSNPRRQLARISRPSGGVDERMDSGAAIHV